MTSRRLEKRITELSTALRKRIGFEESLRGAIVAVAIFVSGTFAVPAIAVDQPETTAGLGAMPPGQALTPSDLTQLGNEVTRRLSSGTFDQRQQAMFEMWRTRLSNREAIAAATADPDPEVSTRAQWILDRWRRGILPDTPLDLARQLESMSHWESLQRLLEKGMFASALVAIDEAKRTGDQATLTRLATLMQRGFPFYIRMADKLDQMELFADLINRIATTSDLIVSRNQLWATIGKGDALADLGDGAGQGANAETDRQRLEVIALAAANRLADATAAAAKAQDPELLRVCQLLSGDWAGLAKTQAELARGEAVGSDDADRHWAYVLVAAARSGDDDLRSTAIAALSFRESDQEHDSREDAYVRLRWQVLAMHGEIDAAIAIVEPSQPLIAAELLSQSGRMTEALKMAGVKPDEVDQSVGPLVDEALLASRKWGSPQLESAPEPLQRLVAIARLFYQSGRRDIAFELFSRAASQAPPEANAGLPIARAYILQSMLRINRPDWLAKILNQGEESAVTGTGRNYLAHVFEVESETLDSLTMGLGFILKSSDTPLAEAVFDFLDGEVPERFNPKTDYQRLFDILTGQAVVQRESVRDQRFRNRMPQRITLDFVKIFQSHGQFDLAVRAMLENISMGDNEALLNYAESELQAGRPAAAREIFRSVWQRLEEARQRPSRLNRAEEDVTLAMRAILGEAVSAGRMGDGEEAESLWRLIDLMTCSPSAKMRNAFGETLMEQGFDERAETIYRTLMPWVAFGSDEGLQFQSVARNFSRALGQRHEKLAADVFDLAIAGTIESTFFYPAGYVLFPTLVHRMKVTAAIAAGDQAEINRQIDALLRLSPMDIDFGENAIKKMRAAGMDDLAQQTIARIYDAGSQYMRQFPLDIVTGNNLAWVMALADYRLEDALALSQQTVYFAPDSTVYRDTLAEVLFRLGRVDEAIAIEQACLLDGPGEWHVHEQLQRFGVKKAK